VKILISTQDILKLAIPISLALLIPQINFLTNTAFIGRLGQDELGVNGIAGVFYLLLAMLGYGLSNGLQVLMARRVGEGNRKGLGKLFGNGIVLSIVFSIVLMMLSLWFAPLLFGMTLHNDKHIYMSVDFLFVRVWGLPFLMLTQLVNSFFIATSRSKFIIYGSIVAALCNILFDYLLIFGHGGFTAMGLHGAAIASVLAEIAACIIMYSIFYFNRMHKKYEVRNILYFDFALSRNVLNVASPLIFQYFFSIGGWQLFFIFVEHLGNKELAASQILRSVLGIVGVCTWAFASACNTLVSRSIGQGLQNEVPRLILKIVKLSLLTTSVICLFLLCGSSYFLSLYTNDTELIAFAIPSLRIVALATLTMSVATVVFNGVVGTGNTLVNLTMEIACVGFYIIYCVVFIQQLHFPLYVAWASEFVYWCSLLLIAALYLKSGRWKGKVI
jgi:multidrug resistance protein, MATE family